MKSQGQILYTICRNEP